MTSEDLFVAIGRVDDKRLARSEKRMGSAVETYEELPDENTYDEPAGRSGRKTIKTLWLIAAVVGIAALLMGSAVIIRYVFPEAPVLDMPRADSGLIDPERVHLSVQNVSATSMRIFCTVDGIKENEESLFIITDGPYTIEKQTEEGWEQLPVKIEAPERTTEPVLTEGSYDWGVNWSAIYGALDNGTYRFTATILEGNVPMSVEFTVQTGTQDEYERILSGEAYGIVYTYRYEFGSMDHLPSGSQNQLKEYIEDALLFREEFWKCGDDLLNLLYKGDKLWIGMMYKDGIRYSLDFEGNDRTNPVIGWSQWPALDINRLTVWFNGISDRKMKAEKEYTDGGVLQKVTGVTKSETFANYFEVETTTTEVWEISLDPALAAAKFAEQDVNVARPFSWEEEQQKRKALDVEFVNVTALPVGNATEAIARATAECVVEYDKIIVYRDEEAGIWKVEFQDGYGYRGYQFVYLDDNGITQMISGAGSKVEAWKDQFPDP